MKKTESKTAQTLKRVLCLVLLLCVAAVCVFFYLRFGKMWDFVKNTDRLTAIEQFKGWFEKFGVWSGVVFVGVRALQTVVKIVPAEPLEIGSGLLFGAVGGMLLCLLGNILGSIVILFLTRKLGTRVLELFHLDKKLHNMRFLQDKEKRIRLLFLFYLIPGTPKDGITYFVGLTDVNLVEYMVITSFARIPSILTSTICGASIDRQNIPLAIGVFVGTAVLSVLGGFAYKKIASRYAERRAPDEAQTEDAAGEAADENRPA